jgi:hypothetical protein
VLRPGLSDAEPAFPALRRARGKGAQYRGPIAGEALAPPEGNWSHEVLARHADALVALEVAMTDATDPLDGLTVIEPFVAPRIANRIDVLDERSGAVFECDVEGEGRYRVRFCSVRWTRGSKGTARDFAEFFRAWRAAALGRLAASSVPNEDLTPNVVNARAFAWCLGPRDRMQVTLEDTNRGQLLSVTRAWAERRDVCT